MKALQVPFDSAWILKNRRKIKKELLADGTPRIEKKIAVLGGSTTNDIVSGAVFAGQRHTADFLPVGICPLLAGCHV